MQLKQTERELTKQIMKYLSFIPNSSFKKIRGSLGMRGVLDIIGCYEGKYYELEIKTERGKLSVFQKDRIEEIRKAGGIATVITSVEDMHKVLGSPYNIKFNF